MDSVILIIGGVLLGLIIGFIIAKALERNNASKLIKSSKKTAASILKEAKSEGESIKKDKNTINGKTIRQQTKLFST